MATQSSRRGFLKGTFRPKELALRPPGALTAGFEEKCQDCAVCIDACPENIILADDQGRATIDFVRGSCSFCGVCAQACPTGALDPDLVSNWPWRANVTASCLAMNGVTCRTCQDVCDARAIRFQLQTGGRAQPVLDETACTGCGTCVGTCPVGAVEFARVPVAGLEAAQ